MKDIFFLVQPGILLLDIAGPSEVFRIAQKIGQQDFQLHFIGVESSIETSVGLTVANIMPLPERLPENALLFLMGTIHNGLDCNDAVMRLAVDWLKQVFDPSHHQIACVCAGTILAAHAGLVDGRRCTTHHDLTSRLTILAPKAQVERNCIFVTDGPIMSSAGITAGIDLALHIVAKISGERVAMDVARNMVIYYRRAGDDKQHSPWLSYRNHINPIIHRIQDIIAHDLKNIKSLSELAEIAGMSARHLTRLFRKEAGISIVSYQQSLRIAVAKQELAAGGTVESAALVAGFETIRSLHRLWKRYEKGTPGEIRVMRESQSVAKKRPDE